MQTRRRYHGGSRKGIKEEMFGDEFIQRALFGAPIILFSLTVHEYFHAWTAYRFGDTTARDRGRLTLNPLAHLDLVGTLVMVLSQFRFGWAKPVPVNPYNLRNRRFAHFWVSAAGPLSNVGLALIAGFLYRVIQGLALGTWPVMHFLTIMVSINITLAVFNLIPLFPLDGSHIFKYLLPEELEPKLAQFDRIAPFILILLMVTGVLWVFLWPPVVAVIRLILGG